jgi:hypothetical protein
MIHRSYAISVLCMRGLQRRDPISNPFDHQFDITSVLPTILNLSDQTTSKRWFLLEICRVKRNCNYLPIGALRRTSSEKFSRKVTWFCASAVAIGINAAMRLPVGQPPSQSWYPNIR